MKRNKPQPQRNRTPIELRSLAAVRGGSDLTTTSEDNETAATPILFTKCALGRD